MVEFVPKIISVCISLTLLALTILLSVGLSSSHHSTAQTLESIVSEKNTFKNNPQIELGGGGGAIAVNPSLNKIYVTDPTLNTVSVIDSRSGNITKNIPVGLKPMAIAVAPYSNKVYVANYDNDTVSVIDGFTNKNLKNITVGNVLGQ